MDDIDCAYFVCRLDDVMYDPEAAQQREATLAEEKVQVQRCKEHVDDLASHLAGACAAFCLADSETQHKK